MADSRPIGSEGQDEPEPSRSVLTTSEVMLIEPTPTEGTCFTFIISWLARLRRFFPHTFPRVTVGSFAGLFLSLVLGQIAITVFMNLLPESTLSAVGVLLAYFIIVAAICCCICDCWDSEDNNDGRPALPNLDPMPTPDSSLSRATDPGSISFHLPSSRSRTSSPDASQFVTNEPTLVSYSSSRDDAPARETISRDPQSAPQASSRETVRTPDPQLSSLGPAPTPKSTSGDDPQPVPGPSFRDPLHSSEMKHQEKSVKQSKSGSKKAPERRKESPNYSDSECTTTTTISTPEGSTIDDTESCSIRTHSSPPSTKPTSPWDFLRPVFAPKNKEGETEGETSNVTRLSHGGSASCPPEISSEMDSYTYVLMERSPSSSGAPSEGTQDSSADPVPPQRGATL